MFAKEVLGLQFHSEFNRLSRIQHFMYFLVQILLLLYFGSVDYSSVASPKFSPAMQILNYHFFRNSLFSQSMNTKKFA